MSLTEDQKQELQADYVKLIAFYHAKVKEVVVASERLNPDQKMSIPAVIEIRSAFDHIARVHEVMYGSSINNNPIGGAPNFEYCKKNLDKAHGHLYRAAYDAYDVIAIALAMKIEKMLKEISQKAIFAVIQDATQKIHVPFTSALDIVTKEKIKKDVASKEEEESQFMQYEKATTDLANVLDVIQGNMPALVAYDDEVKKDASVMIKISILIAVVALLVGWLLAKVF